MAVRDDVIDFPALEAELRAELESDRKYQRENEAKLRAAAQRVTYSQFRDLVLSSHLKPLEKSDRDRVPRKQPWNPVAPGNQPGPVAPGNQPGPVAPGNQPGPVAPGNQPGPVAPGNQPGPVAPGNQPGPVAPGNQ